ncbi:MAG: hypothetical protein JXR68_12840 [Bacteroidales bacterium]|nr:hypothetical protein [Bacteroidales bacterium]
MPEISCVDNQNVTADAANFYIVQKTEFDPTNYSDNCEIATVINDFNSSSTLENAQLPEGATTII